SNGAVADVSAVVIPAIADSHDMKVREVRTDAFISHCCRIATNPRRASQEVILKGFSFHR
ncbi:MAG TPA: hypothetical protein VMM15_35330, partial [Bradyrhizobium sp.]|nr:hypothetical protein [Bradyrhizobium sp.]